jgi:hypothetical protein
VDQDPQRANEEPVLREVEVEVEDRLWLLQRRLLRHRRVVEDCDDWVVGDRSDRSREGGEEVELERLLLLQLLHRPVVEDCDDRLEEQEVDKGVVVAKTGVKARETREKEVVERAGQEQEGRERATPMRPDRWGSHRCDDSSTTFPQDRQCLGDCSRARETVETTLL